MAIVVPAITGKMGSIEYFESNMKARELAAVVRPARETDDWSSGGIEERMQRELQMKRVLEEIAPYLAKSQDRFTGAVIVLVRDPKIYTFEPVEQVGGRIPAAYRGVASRLGFLTLEGGDLIYLDGQHRGAAFRYVIQDPKDGEKYTGGDVANDDVCVIFVKFESTEKTRRIFNKVNRYARSTSRADNIITSEDDGYAIVARRLLRDNEPLGVRDRKSPNDLIVDWRSNTITGRSTKLTTLSAIYETVKVILKHEGIKDFDEKSRVIRPPELELDHAYGLVKEWWVDLLEGITAYQDALTDNSTIPSLREGASSVSLLFKPAGQIAMIQGLTLAVHRGGKRAEMIPRLNRINWSTIHPMWRGTIVRESGKMSARTEDVELGGELIAYLIGAKHMNGEAKKALQDRYTAARNAKYILGSGKNLEPLPEFIRK